MVRRGTTHQPERGERAVAPGRSARPVDLFASLSPLDHRYAAEDPELFAELSRYLSEAAYLRYQLRVEVALVYGLVQLGLAPPQAAVEIEKAAACVSPEEVAEEESRTQHNVRALVNCIRRRMPEAYRQYVHWSATSVDILDTARALQYKDATRHLILPSLKELLEVWIAITKREADTPQIGRTHGQHAVPITFGFAMAWYVQRLGDRIRAVEAATGRLVGKMAGAVGAYNAASLRLPQPERLEEAVLKYLGIAPAPISTQIAPPEPVLDWAHALISTFGVLANFADDMRHLQRSEIGEVGEAFSPEQVGSSTMPHKRNPWNFEHVKSLWKAFMPRILTVYMDQISEHQRDLTNSASGRFLPEMAAVLVHAARRLTKVSRTLVVDRKRMQENLQESAGLFTAEPLYILLAAAGHPDAHEAVRRLTLQPAAREKSLIALAENDPELAVYLARLRPQERELLHHPERYQGRAREKALQIAAHWEEYLASEA
ncbi:MAG: adenylosuccinate lyase [Limnochordales bacterium]|nr:adenylosuccinate lyase [Limnochordales bacterium]